MNLDFAIILNFKLKSAKDVDVDFLVKTARNIGARVVAADAMQEAFSQACSKYTIAWTPAQEGLNLTAANAVDALVLKRKAGQQAIINIPVTSDGQFSSETAATLAEINKWMHIFGHAVNEGEPCNVKVTNVSSSFVLQNRHENYQKYVFIKAPLAKEIKVAGLTAEPNRVEMIAKRVEPKFTYQNDALLVDLTNIATNNFTWQILRIQEHRPEDDIKETKY